jgi:hypothetical protein
MRLRLLLICGLLAACTSGPVTVPDDPILSEVPYGGAPAPAGGDAFTGTIEGALASDGTVPANMTLAGSASGTGRALDDDRINLMQWTLEQQKIDAAIAERDLANARSQLVVVQPGPLPPHPEGVNIALFASQTTNAVGQSIYPRGVGARVSGVGNCGRFRNADAAQRAFLSGGGPEADRYGLDPDGDGFACKWDPTPYRALR